jgi:bifunctional non-homologous end joining protein LigD
VSWTELEAAADPADLTFTIADVPGRLAAQGDLLAPLLEPSAAAPLP